MKKKRVIIHVCYFLRDKSGKIEKGVRIGEGGAIIDLNRNVVNKVYNCSSAFDEGPFMLEK